MQSLTDWCWGFGWFRHPRSARDAAECNHEPVLLGPDAEKVQRLLELQDELHQLDRLPGVLASVLAGGAGDPMMRLTPIWQERALEIEAEMAQLREEMSLEALEREASHPRASEEIGQRILQQINARGRAEGPAAARRPESWSEADALLSNVGVYRANGGE